MKTNSYSSAENKKIDKQSINNRRNKKKRISKHILASQKDSGASNTSSSSEGKGKGKANNSSSNNRKVKDINEAASYLVNWRKYREQWKFNKNTQSWLIRHMYEPEKLGKATFTILLDYLKGLKGKEIKQRIIQDANRRAIRYKKHEDKAKEQEGKVENDEIKRKKEINDVEVTKNTVEDTEGEKWNQLNNHNKRKEYKRARKILEIFEDE